MSIDTFEKIMIVGYSTWGAVAFSLLGWGIGYEFGLWGMPK